MSPDSQNKLIFSSCFIFSDEMGDGNMSGRSQNNQPAKSTNGVGVGDVGSVISANVYNSNSNEGSDVNHNSVITDDGLDDIQPLKTINR